MAKKKTKKPSGLSITRNGSSWTLKWKIGDSDYGAGQKMELTVNGVTSKPSISKTATQYTFSNASVNTISFKVQGCRKKSNKKTYKYSDWTSCSWKTVLPKAPTVSYESTGENRGKFKWSVPSDTTSTAIRTEVEYQTDTRSDDANNPDMKTSVSTSTGTSGEPTYTEDTSAIADGPLVRWFRIRAVGPAGPSKWVYAHHAYGTPDGPELIEASAETISASVSRIKAKWNVKSTTSKPIDTVTVQYAINAPTDADLSAPSGGWSDAIALEPTGTDDTMVVNIDDVIAADQCMWVRIKTEHDNYPNYSNELLAQVGRLAAPGINATPNFSTGVTSITITKNTSCGAAATAIFYRSEDDPSNDQIVAILTGDTVTTTVTVSDLVGKTTSCFGAFAFVGTYDGLTVNPVMLSDKATDEDIAIVAPASVTITEGPRDETVRINWEWTWTDALQAELAWSEHDEAWESTEEPSTYTVTERLATSWVIAGLEVGKRYFFRVRLIGEQDAEEVIGPWSNPVSYYLTSVPDNPVLTLSKSVINEGGTVTARWAYSAAGDDTEQAYAEIAIVTEDETTGDAVYTVIAHTDVSQSLELAYDWQTGTTYQLAVRITTTSGMQTAWSEVATLYVAEPVEVSVNSATMFIQYTAQECSLTSSAHVYQFEDEQIISELETTDYATVDELSINGTVLDQSNYTIDMATGVITFNPAITLPAESAITVKGLYKSNVWTETSGNVLYNSYNLRMYQPGNVSVRSRGTVATYYFQEILTATFAMYQLPTTVTVTGAGETGTTILSIVRAEDYHLDRPDERDFDGFAGETIYTYSQTGEDVITIALDDLIGHLDYGAKYTLIATVTDDYGQSATEEILFTVDWTFCASVPSVVVEMDKYARIAKITPIKGSWIAQGTCDIYRLTADKPELIVKDAEYGTTYVDPYPGFGEMCGHRVVAVSNNGDYVTAANRLAWYDADRDDYDYLDEQQMVIDVGGDQIELPYNIRLTNRWTKDFKRTSYLGGSVQGDWNPAVTRDLSAETVLIRNDDLDSALSMRDLAGFAGVAHIRTPDGSSLTADIQIQETQEYSTKKISYSMTVSAIDPGDPVGMTLEEWEAMQDELE